MSQTRLTELKNKLIKVQENALVVARKLITELHEINAWCMDIQKKYMNKESALWHSQWQVRWLERVLIRKDPKIKLYHDEIYADENKKEKK